MQWITRKEYIAAFKKAWAVGHVPLGVPRAETGDVNQADARGRVQACKVSNRLVAFSLVEVRRKSTRGQGNPVLHCLSSDNDGRGHVKATQ